jgi:lipoyl(octanoyl) transferase
MYSPTCVVMRLGLTPYEQAWQLQQIYAAQIANGERRPTLLLLEHPHTFTFGRRGQAKNLLWDEAECTRRGVAVHWVDRGGDVTYHGPGQLVGYPLLPLAPGGLNASLPGDSAQPHLPQADYIGYLRKLEEVIIRSLARLGVVSGQIQGLTGVWVQPDALARYAGCRPEQRQYPSKIAAIGVKVDVHGISRHGFALNIDPDMSYWDGIIGCGLNDTPVTSLAEILHTSPSMEQMMDIVTSIFGEIFKYRMVEAEKEC